jgi:hypothetical protein
MLLVLAAAICGACGSAASDAAASSSSVATPTSLVTTSVSMSVPPTTMVAGPTQPTSSDSLAPDGAVPGEADVVVAAAIHRLYRATGMADPPTVDEVRVIDRYGQSSSSAYLEPGGRVIDEDVRTAVEQALAPSAVEWVDDSTDVMGDLASVEDGTHQDIVVLLTFGEPMIDGQQATIAVDMLCGLLCGSGTTYTLERSDAEGWTVTSTTEGWVA